MLRSTLATLALGLASAQIDVSIDAYHAHLEVPGFATLSNDAGAPHGDVVWNGTEVILMNGALEQYLPVVEGTASVTSATMSLSAAVSLPDGTGYIFYLAPPKLSAAPGYSAWLSSQLEDGPKIPTSLLSKIVQLGPNPDLSNPAVTGSPRVAWHRCEMLQALLLEGVPTAEQLQELRRWTGDQWKRSVHFYSRAQQGRPYVFLEHPKSIPAWGYAAPGGFSTAYSSTEFFGRDDASPGKPAKASGWWPEDEEHTTAEGVAADAMLLGSYAAKVHLADMVEKHAAFNAKGTWSNPRSFGWVARFYAVAYATLAPDPAFADAAARIRESYLPTLIAKLESANVGDFNVLDAGLKCDHLCVTPAMAALGASPSAAKGQCIWQTAILVLGLDRVLTDVPLPPELATRIRVQVLKARGVMLSIGRAPGWDIVDLQLKTPTLMWNDVAPSHLGRLPESLKGTFSSVVLPALDIIRKRYAPTQVWKDAAAACAGAILADEQGYWQGGKLDFLLDSAWSSGLSW